MAVFGYIRVSTNKGQTTENQLQEIVAAGYNVSEWFSEDAVSGSTPQFERKAFMQMWNKCQEGDVCIFSKIDRLGRNAADTLTTVEKFREKGIKVVVLQFGGVDMASSAGKFLTSILAACAEMERDLCIERINSGLARTKLAGTVLGPRLKISTKIMIELCAKRKGGLSLDKLSNLYRIDRSTIDRNIKLWGDKIDEYDKIWSKQQLQKQMKKKTV